jgi:hypothetical protein
MSLIAEYHLTLKDRTMVWLRYEGQILISLLSKCGDDNPFRNNSFA